MTRKEAIARIKDHNFIHKMDEPRAIHISEAIDMAIKALEQEPKTGHWKKYVIPRCEEQIYLCTNCGYYINFGKCGDFYTKEFKYCPKCGAKMIEEK